MVRRISSKPASAKTLKMLVTSKGAGVKRVRKVAATDPDHVINENPDPTDPIHEAEPATNSDDGLSDVSGALAALAGVGAVIAEPEEDEREAAAEVEAYKTISVANSKLVVGGLPAASSAYTWALTVARKLKLPVEIHEDATGSVLFTVDAEHLKASKVKAKKAPGAPRKSSGPAPYIAQAISLAQREQGVTRGELAGLTPGREQPWTQILKRIAEQQGFKFNVVELGKDSNRGGRVAYQFGAG